MDRLIKFADYDGWLPKPSRLTGDLFSLSGYPDSLCDGYAIDIHNHQSKDGVRIRKSSTISGIILDLSKADFLSEPMYVSDNFCDMNIFVVFNPKTKVPIVLQTKYYNYFYFRYRECRFTGTGSTDPVGVLYADEVVGAIMPVATSVGIDIPPYEE